jgi:hypothetical protein
VGIITVWSPWDFATPAALKNRQGGWRLGGHSIAGWVLLDRARPLLRHVGGVAKPKILGGGHSDHAVSIRQYDLHVKRRFGRCVVRHS